MSSNTFNNKNNNLLNNNNNFGFQKTLNQISNDYNQLKIQEEETNQNILNDTILGEKRDMSYLDNSLSSVNFMLNSVSDPIKQIKVELEKKNQLQKIEPFSGASLTIPSCTND